MGMLDKLLNLVVWNSNYEDEPAGGDSPSFGDDAIREDKKGVRERFEKEHKMNLLSGVVASDGWHKRGSAIGYYQAATPTTRPDGTTALTDDDAGRLWWRTSLSLLYIYTGTATGWLLFGEEVPIKGYAGVSLTEWALANTTKPEIASGSRIEIDGVLWEYSVDTSLTDEAGIADGWCYILHDVSSGSLVPTLTNTWGTWDTAKQGYYDGSGNRYSLFVMYRSGAVTKIFTGKSALLKDLLKYGIKHITLKYEGTTEANGQCVIVVSPLDEFTIVDVSGRTVLYGTHLNGVLQWYTNPSTGLYVETDVTYVTIPYKMFVTFELP